MDTRSSWLAVHHTIMRNMRLRSEVTHKPDFSEKAGFLRPCATARRTPRGAVIFEPTRPASDKQCWRRPRATAWRTPRGAVVSEPTRPASDKQCWRLGRLNPAGEG